MNIDLQILQTSTKKILLLGLGTENSQFLEWLVDDIKIDKNRIIIADHYTKNIDEQKSKFDFEFINYSGIDQWIPVTTLHTVGFVFKTPGIWSLDPRLTQWQQKHPDDYLGSGLIFFFQKFHTKITLITGTKGKTTTASMLTHIYNELGKSAYHLANSTNISPYKYWQDEKINQFILELSSFQLQDLKLTDSTAHINIITNLYTDHQDQHHTIEEYHRAKLNAFVNATNKPVLIISSETATKIISLGVEILQQTIYIDNTIQTFQTRFHTSLPGLHNQCNWSAAILAYKRVHPDTSDQQIQSAIDTFTNVNHRLQLVQTMTVGNGNQIHFYDDGASTEPESTCAAISALTNANDEKLILIITGKDKGVDISRLVFELIHNERIIRVYLGSAIGRRVWESLATEVPQFLDKFFLLPSLTSINQHIQKNLQDQLKPYRNLRINIALSPSGSSFDEFQNYIDRSQQWTKWVKSLICSELEQIFA